MKKFLFCIYFFLCSCSLPITYSDTHQQKNPNSNLLPALNTKISVPNLRAAFSDATDDEGKPDYNLRNVMADDAVNIFEREVEENITLGEGEKRGYISFRVTYVQLDNSTGLRALSMATLGLLNAVGLPMDKFTQTMEVEIEIMNKKRDVVKRYTQVVETSAYRAYYWGYKRKDINRKVSADNVKEALRIIREKINKDASEILERLK